MSLAPPAPDQQREPEKVRLYVGQTAKVCIVLLAFMASIASASSQDVQALLFPKAYGAAADELRLLVWGFSGYSFAVTSAWILNSAKRSRAAVVLVAAPLLAFAFSFAWLALSFGVSQRRRFTVEPLYRKQYQP